MSAGNVKKIRNKLGVAKRTHARAHTNTVCGGGGGGIRQTKQNSKIATDVHLKNYNRGANLERLPFVHLLSEDKILILILVHPVE